MQERPVIFLAFANDHADYLYKLTEEQHAIRQALKRVEREGLCEVVYETDTDLNKIWSTFNEYQDRIAVFHYGGHAEDYSLLLKKASGERQFAHGEGLVSFLAQQKGLQLVFINGCCSKRQAEELRDKGIPAVIGTSEPINDDAATELSAAFYEGLAHGRPLHQAWLGAKDLVRAQNGSTGINRGFSRDVVFGEAGIDFPWELYIRPGAEEVKEWNLPRAARNPLFGLPLPRSYYLRLPGAPFVGLHYFREDDAAVFFGRGAQIRELYNHIKGIYPIILMYGRSGVGKSSVLDAGLVPRISDDYVITYARRIQEKGLYGTLDLALDELLDQPSAEELPETRPNGAEDELRQLLHAAADKATDLRLRRQLRDLLGNLEQSKAADRPLLVLTGILKKWLAAEKKYQRPLIVILDQAEEKFTRPMPAGSQQDELIRFLTALQPLFSGADSGIRGKLILSYRKEYHPEIRDAFRSLSLPFSELFLKRLDREGIIEAIRGVNHSEITRKQYGLIIEGNLPEIIADDLMEDPESPIAPVLQIILVKLWETAEKEEGQPVHFTVRQYQELRKQGTTMGEFFQQQMEQFAEKYPEAVRSGLALDLLYAHTTEMGTSGSCRGEKLFERYDLDRSLLSAMIQELKDLSLLNRIDKAERGAENSDQDHTTILAHDTLAPVVIREYNLSDAPGQRAARILNNKLSDVGYRLSPEYLEKLRLTGTGETVLKELGKETVGLVRFLALQRNLLGEEQFQQDREQVLATAEINLAPNGKSVFLEESDLAIVEEGGGLTEGAFPGMGRLSRAGELLVEDSRRLKREREEKERRQEEEKRLQEEEKRRLMEEKLEAEQRYAKKQRQRSVVISVFFGLALIAAIFGWYQRREAIKNEEMANENLIKAKDAGEIAKDNAMKAQRNLEGFQKAEADKVRGEIRIIQERAKQLGTKGYINEEIKHLEGARVLLNKYRSNPQLDGLRDTINRDLQLKTD